MVNYKELFIKTFEIGFKTSELILQDKIKKLIIKYEKALKDTVEMDKIKNDRFQTICQMRGYIEHLKELLRND